MAEQRDFKAVWLQFLSVQMNVEARRQCLVLQPMNSEGIVVLTMDAIAFAKQVQTMMELAIWFRTLAIDCLDLKLRVIIGLEVLPVKSKYHLLVCLKHFKDF